MNNAKFPAKLIEIEFFSHEGIRYDQDLFVESKNGETFWIQDVRLFCDDEMKGKTLEIEFSVSQSFSGDNLVKQGHKEKKIVFRKPDSKNKYPRDEPIFYGEIVGRKDDPRYLIVDVGSGTIIVSINTNEVDNFLIGDYIKIDSLMIHLCKLL
ncbi:hypothetical protein [Methanococcus maripaludis]|uniref:Uncharacterized protein n=1 Tax=Methanococcus maripaludis TaxID=39152 RepID=A0A7J9PCS4_METMI|nr:hypothetical protein [Methanococcus maripaludis]MBA2861045.1 hypothetical protein [Methanococcus maripaludis]